MRSSSQLPNLTVEEYLEGELRSEVKHEYVAGQVFAMTGTSFIHNRIMMNLGATLHARLRGGPCRVYSAEIKVHVKASNAFYYPDIVVTCEPHDLKGYVLNNPTLIVEILSPSTEHIDRREKLIAYRKLESLREYLIVDQDQQEVTVHRRDGEARWWQDVYGPGGTIRLESIGLDLALDAIYEGV